MSIDAGFVIIFLLILFVVFLLPIIALIVLISVAPAVYHVLKDSGNRQAIRDGVSRAVNRRGVVNPTSAPVDTEVK